MYKNKSELMFYYNRLKLIATDKEGIFIYDAFAPYIDKLPDNNISFLYTNYDYNAQGFALECLGVTEINLSVFNILNDIKNGNLNVTKHNLKNNLDNIVYTKETALPLNFEKENIICVAFPISENMMVRTKLRIIEGNKRISNFIKNNDSLDFDILEVQQLGLDINHFTDIYSQFLYSYTLMMYNSHSISKDVVVNYIKIISSQLAYQLNKMGL